MNLRLYWNLRCLFLKKVSLILARNSFHPFQTSHGTYFNSHLVDHHVICEFNQNLKATGVQNVFLTTFFILDITILINEIFSLFQLSLELSSKFLSQPRNKKQSDRIENMLKQVMLEINNKKMCILQVLIISDKKNVLVNTLFPIYFNRMEKRIYCRYVSQRVFSYSRRSIRFSHTKRLYFTVGIQFESFIDPKVLPMIANF